MRSTHERCVCAHVCNTMSSTHERSSHRSCVPHFFLKGLHTKVMCAHVCDRSCVELITLHMSDANNTGAPDSMGTEQVLCYWHMSLLALCLMSRCESVHNALLMSHDTWVSWTCSNHVWSASGAMSCISECLVFLTLCLIMSCVFRNTRQYYVLYFYFLCLVFLFLTLCRVFITHMSHVWLTHELIGIMSHVWLTITHET